MDLVVRINTKGSCQRQLKNWEYIVLTDRINGNQYGYLQLTDGVCLGDSGGMVGPGTVSATGKLATSGLGARHHVMSFFRAITTGKRTGSIQFHLLLVPSGR